MFHVSTRPGNALSFVFFLMHAVIWAREQGDHPNKPSFGEPTPRAFTRAILTVRRMYVPITSRWGSERTVRCTVSHLPYFQLGRHVHLRNATRKEKQRGGPRALTREGFVISENWTFR